MALIIRLRQQGKNSCQSYRLVVADRRSPRDGKYIEKLGFYDPFLPEGKNFSVSADRVKHWLEVGSLISPKAVILVKKAAPEVIAFWKGRQEAKKMKKVEKRAKKKA